MPGVTGAVFTFTVLLIKHTFLFLCKLLLPERLNLFYLIDWIVKTSIAIFTVLIVYNFSNAPDRFSGWISQPARGIYAITSSYEQINVVVGLAAALMSGKAKNYSQEFVVGLNTVHTQMMSAERCFKFYDFQIYNLTETEYISMTDPVTCSPFMNLTSRIIPTYGELTLLKTTPRPILKEQYDEILDARRRGTYPINITLAKFQSINPTII